MKNIELYSWIIRGKQRREILKNISDVQTPTQLSNKSGYSLNHTSRILREFTRKGIVKCLNPKAKTGRIYKITPKGKRVRDELKQN